MERATTLAEMIRTSTWVGGAVERLYDLDIDDPKEQLAIIKAVRDSKVFHDDEHATVDSFDYFGENYTAAEFLQSSHYDK